MRQSTTSSATIIISLGMLYLLSGCSAGDKLYQGAVGVVNPDKVKLSTKLIWMNPQPPVRPVPTEKKVVLYRVRNSSGSDIDFGDCLAAELRKQGYTVTDDLNTAQYDLSVDLRHFGESAEAGKGGVIAGAATGGVLGGVAGRMTGKSNTWAGAGIGAVLGGVGGHILDNRNPMRAINLIADIRIGERIATGVTTQRGSETNTEVDHNNSIQSEAGNEFAKSIQTSSEKQSTQVHEDFLYHNNRLVCSAEKVGLTLAEAAPVLVDRMSRGLASTLP